MFPTTPVLDDFNRPDAASAGPQWARISAGFQTIAIQSLQGADPTAGGQFAWGYWTPTVFGPDCEAFYTISNYGNDGSVRVGARFINEGTGAASGYLVSVTSAGVWLILRETSLGANTLTTGPTQALSSGDKIGIRIIGTAIFAMYAPVGEDWRQVASYDVQGDATQYLAAGRVVAEFNQSLIDDFGGGNYNPGVPGPNVGRSLAGRFA